MEHLLKTKKEYKNLKRQEIDIYRNELDKACFWHDMVYRDFKDLTKRTASDRILRDKAFNIAINIKEVLLLWFIIFLIKRLLVEQLNPSHISNLKMNFINQS